MAKQGFPLALGVTTSEPHSLEAMRLISTRCLLGLLSLLTAACSSMLPVVHNESSPFTSFDDARRAIDSLVPMKSDVETLTRMGIDPAKQANTTILTQADVVRRFVPSALLQREDLDPGVLVCLQARDDCRGWEIQAAQITKARTGNFLADFTNFSRRSETTGWRFNALILLVKDRVVYRAWGGQPKVNEIEVNTNPLGPLQEMGPSLLTTH